MPPLNASIPDLELVCLGPPTARVEGNPAHPEVLWRKHLALLIYLALSPHRTRTRQHLLGLLWPDREESAGRHSLNEAIRRLRVHLGPHRISSDGDSVTLSDAGLTVDVLAETSAMAGEFLEGFSLSDATAFEEWAAAERDRYRAKAVAALVRAGAQALLDSDTLTAQDLARRALALEPYSEPAAGLLIRSAALGGDAVGGLAAYHAFSDRLATELREQPSRELIALADRIRHGRWRGSGFRRAGSDIPLIRRASHRDALAVVADVLVSGARTLIVTGDPGSGRTALAAECLDHFALEGAVLATARPLETDHDAPWSTLRAIMRAGLANAAGVAGTDPTALSLLADLVPELATRVVARAPRDRAEVAAAIGALLRSVAEETPVALAIDDAQFADGATVGALHAAISELDHLPVLLVVVTSPGVARSGPPELLELCASVGGSVPGCTVRLDPLSVGEVRELVRLGAPWCIEEAARDRLVRRIGAETTGNVFLIATLLRALGESALLREDVFNWPVPDQTLDSPLPISVPALARMAIAARVGRLDEASQRVLTIASVLGLEMDPELLAKLADMAEPRVQDALTTLERLDFVVFDGERYAFSAPLVAQVIRGEFVTPGEQRILQQRIVGLLAPRLDLESRLLRTEFQARLEPGNQVVTQALAIAREAIASAARRTATRALAVAERAIGTGNAAGAVELEQLRQSLRSQPDLSASALEPGTT